MNKISYYDIDKNDNLLFTLEYNDNVNDDEADQILEAIKYAMDFLASIGIDYNCDTKTFSADLGIINEK